MKILASKKLWFLLMLLLMAALVAAACASGEVRTAEQAQEQSKAEATTTEEPKAEETRVEEATTEVAPTEASQAEEVAPNKDSQAEIQAETSLEGVELNVWFSAVGDEAIAYGELIEQFEQQTGATVEVITAPQSATNNLAQILQFMGTRSNEIDVFQIDVTWPGILAEHAVDLNEYIPHSEIEAHFPAIIENNTIAGKLVGLPWFTDAGLLYYRTDLLAKYGYDSPPEIWDELEEMAQTIQEGERAEGNDLFWGFVWQGSNYEGLTCAALEWQYSHNGGRIIEPDGVISVNNPNAAAALSRAAGWVDRISPPGVTSYQEESSRDIWQSGNAAFMRNWPYAYALGNSLDSPIKGKFAVTVLPAGTQKHAATLGGWQLMVSNYSKSPAAAAEFVRFIAGREAQKTRAISFSFLPTISQLYRDQDVLNAQPFMGGLFEVFTHAIARPSSVSGELYSEVSAAYFNGVHAVLIGKLSAEEALQDIEDELADITSFEAGQPQDPKEN